MIVKSLKYNKREIVMSNCYICNSNAEITQISSDSKLFDCPKCGKFYISGSMESYILEKEDKSNYYKVSSWIREQNDEFNNTPILDNFDDILEMRDKTIQEKFDLLMIHLPKDNDFVELTEEILIKCWIKRGEDLDKFFQKAIDEDYILGALTNVVSQGYHFPLFKGFTFDGLQYLESLDQPNKSSKNIFVAFNFEESLSKIFNTYVKEAIEALGFNYTIVTQNTTTHDKAISDEIIAKLKSSRIVIADFTNHRNSVYFEAGFAMGMKIPIIWTCQEGHENDLSFDTRQYPHLVWIDGEDLKKQISDRIQVII